MLLFLQTLFQNFNLQTFLFLATTCFIASFIDAIAGGGGLISVPAFIASGLPIHIAIGTNKMAASFSVFGSAFRYFKSGKINFSLLKFPIMFGIVGAVLGVILVSRTDEKILQPLILIMLIIVAIYTFLNKNMGIEDQFTGQTKKNTIEACFMAFLLCFYIGFFGPGGGAFMVFGLLKIYKFDFIGASAHAKVLNLVANITSLIVFMYIGCVSYIYSILVGIVMFIGAQCGAKYAIKKGSKFIRPFFLTISILTIGKMIIEKFL